MTRHLSALFLVVLSLAQSSQSAIAGWKHFVTPGYPSFRWSGTTNPGTYPWEIPTGPSERELADGHSGTGWQLTYAANATGVDVSSQQAVNLTGFNEVIRSVDVSATANFSEGWQYEEQENVEPLPTRFGGTVSQSFTLSAQGGVGADLGIFADPADARSTASLSSHWAAPQPIGYKTDFRLGVSGTADNQLRKASIRKITSGVGTLGPIKLFGVVIDFNPVSADSTSLTYSIAANCSATDEFDSVEILAGTVTYSWSTTGLAQTAINSYSNSAQATAHAVSDARMSVGLIPVLVGNGDGTPSDPDLP